MKAIIQRFLTATLLAVTMAPITALAASQADAQKQVDMAKASFERFVSDPNMTWFRNHVGDAKGLLIIPQQVKGGFIIGASGGAGVLIGRGKSANWSYPAFYSMASASVGLQIGGQLSEIVLMVMTDKGMDAMYSTEFKLGADASVAAGPVGAGAQAATADVLAFARTKGAFGGVSLEGAAIAIDNDLNNAYYGRAVRPIEIINDRAVSNKGADPLRQAVARTAGGRASVKRAAPAPSAPAGDVDIAFIQRRLTEMGFDPGPVDGKFGRKTSKAIRDYQSARGEAVTGQPSRALEEALRSN